MHAAFNIAMKRDWECIANPCSIRIQGGGQLQPAVEPVCHRPRGEASGCLTLSQDSTAHAHDHNSFLACNPTQVCAECLLLVYGNISYFLCPNFLTYFYGNLIQITHWVRSMSSHNVAASQYLECKDLITAVFWTLSSDGHFRKCCCQLPIPKIGL